ncbi:MAG: TIGR03936 family radical SAM-associated protein, partial [Geopsychrobacter sp.]|nr:TIGR03936 family radical SAM-associated protein [Geopsychrobacter sp.]
EALPMGLASEAELVDRELLQPVSVEQLMSALNSRLPEGFNVVDGVVIPLKSPSPSASVATTSYRVPLPQPLTVDLDMAINAFLKSEQVLVTRVKKGREEQIDLRPNVLEILLVNDELELKLIKGSPLQVAAHLFALGVEDIRRLQVRKVGITLKDLPLATTVTKLGKN